ncbi:MAG: preprotein translocase subunit SecY [SAR324 cluster bacterium]|jgi:preprotein translocase subunit SecY|nr:preprotein translocase subunit SecY [Deltaproteobacteria bacterium]MDE0906470.1 preprotein translocase subunit SecY [SAR324 cluster bacterium]HIF68135.1 preprotein translocase subunit SecY [Candidatus Lambdaproteobacteria bacterium]MBT45481.1 preprotein translocase subunit SecY [Deltaproteobacteria bacterium]MEC7417386.1 preprotein translocase subunit SecY [SAR324 cluster bacterium]|tara:strand:+ start:5609 stop:6943 length:1335 start_codon:yes stop_codon:yes gene_type:complete
MWATIQNIFRIEELRERIIFTLFMLFVFRIGAHIPTPGIDGSALTAFFEAQQGSILRFFDMFTGGALARLTVFALGVMPYISASIIMQLLTVVFPYLERLSKEGDAGRRKITAYTRYGTIVLSLVQGFAISVGLESMAAPDGSPVVISTMSPWGFRALTVITLTAGTAFLMWVGEQINERGIGNGISLLIFAGIVVDIPGAIINSIQLVQTDQLAPLVLGIVAVLMVVVIFAVIYMETAYRKIPVQYAKRMQGNRMYGGQSSHLPLKINSSGVIPPIFASSILAFPATITGFIAVPWVQAISGQLLPGRLLYSVLFVLMIFFFCFFYTAIQFNPVKIAEEMKRHGGYIPGIRPGKKTAEYVNLVLTRLTFGGAVYLSAVCILPSILFVIFNVPFSFGGTALLIVVGVGLDLVNQIEAHLLNQNYDGFMKKTKRRNYGGTSALRL